MTRKLRDHEIDAILLMVKEAATELEVHDANFLEEYEETLRKTKTVLASDAKWGTYSSPFAYTDIVLGVGLVLLGQTAAALYEYVLQKGLEVGLKKISARLSPNENTSELLEGATKHIVLTLQIPKEIDETQLKSILTPQLTALLRGLESISLKIPNDEPNQRGN